MSVALIDAFNCMNSFLSDMEWVNFRKRLPKYSNELYVAECNNGFISACNWTQQDGELKQFHSLGKKGKPLLGVVRWLVVRSPTSMNIRSNWKDYENIQPSSENGSYLTYCRNGFITVCYWNASNQMFCNFTRTRNINSVCKWIKLPNLTESQHIMTETTLVTAFPRVRSQIRKWGYLQPINCLKKIY